MWRCDAIERESQRRPWYFRLPAHLRFRFQLLNAQREPLGAAPLAGMTHDLGEEGLGFFARRLPQAVLAALGDGARDQATIDLRFRLPGRDIRFSGNISFVHPVSNRNAAMIGVSFTQYEPADVLEVLRYSERLARRRQVLGVAAGIAAAVVALLLIGAWALR